jgi:hypothetical protein
MFESVFSKTPGVYIPVLFKNITVEDLTQIFTDLDLFTLKSISICEKTLTNGQHVNYAFIDVVDWNNTPNAQRMRSKLLNDEPVKIVYNDPWFFICKRKHDEKLPPPPDQIPQIQYVDFTHQYKDVRKDRYQRSSSPSPSPPPTPPCPECESGIDGNQLRHTCIQNEIAKW